MKLKIKVLYFVFMSISIGLDAQVNKKETSDEVYSLYSKKPADIDLIFKNAAKAFYSNAIRLDVSAIGRGNACLIYERRVIPQLSVELTGGLKFYNGLYFANFNDNGYYFFHSTNAKESIVKGIGLKYYFKKQAITQGGFIGLSYLSEQVFIELDPLVPNMEFVENIQLKSYRFNFGVSKLYKNRLALSIGGYGGANIPDKLVTTKYFRDTQLDFGFQFSTGFYFL